MHCILTALIAAIVVAPVAALAQEGHPAGCTCPCHNHNPGSQPQRQEQGGSTTGNIPGTPYERGGPTGSPDQPYERGGPTGSPDQPYEQGGKTTGNGPPDPAPEPPRDSSLPTAKNGRPANPRPTAGLPGTGLPGHPGACPCCSKKGGVQVIQTEKPPDPWVWVEWYDAEIVSTKATAVAENSKVAAPSGAPWTLDIWLTNGSRAALVFFYWPDTKDHRGYHSGKVNSDLWFHEDVACVSRAFDCYRVNAKTASKEALAYYKVKQVPSVLILDSERNRVAYLDKFGNARSLVAFLEDTLKSKFADRWKQYQDGLKEIAKSFSEGKAAVQRQDFGVARDLLVFVVDHEFRTEDYPRAKELLAKLEKKLRK